MKATGMISFPKGKKPKRNEVVEKNIIHEEKKVKKNENR